VPRIRRALISVSDKRGLVPFASALAARKIEIISTGGTLAFLQKNNIAARQVSDVTSFPEILDGRVKTLHPVIHAGLLAVLDNPEHVRQLEEHKITPIDMVVVNLYPFAETVARPEITLEEAIEQIDIGGPSMLRSAAKNFRHTAVIVDPDRYDAVLQEMQAGDGVVSEETCFTLAREVFRHTAAYDAVISGYLDRTAEAATALPATFQVAAPRELALRYGENPHQQAALYGTWGTLFAKLHGKELSFNNIIDVSAAAALAAEFDEPVAVIVKHTNPCGVGTGTTLDEAYDRAFATDTASPFGGIVAVNRPLTLSAAERINQIFTEVIIAPAFPEDVLALLRKKKDRRLITVRGDLRQRRDPDVRSVPGGFLVQEPDVRPPAEEGFRLVTRRPPTEDETRALRFAWRVAKHVKSNAIVYAGPDRTLGIGAGQMSRVDSSRIAARKAADGGLSLQGSAVGSDAFFPFADGLLEAVRAGATAVIQPGGSVRDEEVIAAANEHNIAMIFTGTRHFRH
jgi:phosphoribosylaminoimidazolecarboxamide formyltransferase / IMP cyclohydrolase